MEAHSSWKAPALQLLQVRSAPESAATSCPGKVVSQGRMACSFFHLQRPPGTMCEPQATTTTGAATQEASSAKLWAIPSITSRHRPPGTH